MTDTTTTDPVELFRTSLAARIRQLPVRVVTPTDALAVVVATVRWDVPPPNGAFGQGITNRDLATVIATELHRLGLALDGAHEPEPDPPPEPTVTIPLSLAEELRSVEVGQRRARLTAAIEASR